MADYQLKNVKDFDLAQTLECGQCFHFVKMDEEDYEQFLEVMVRKVDVPVKAVLGKSVITVNDFVNIQVGDIIRLDSKVDDELDVYVGNIKKFTAVPGASKEAYAVRVTSVIREEE